MAAVKALTHICHAGRVYVPGEELTGLPEQAIQSALAHGEATDKAAEADRAADRENDRQHDVVMQQQTRSVKRDHADKT